MLRVGLTGGIACGKTTVVGFLRELGCAVLEADPLAHRAIEPGGPAYHDVVSAFGPGICAPDGSVDRGRLGKMVFADGRKLQTLNRLVHPHVIRAQEQQLAEWTAAGLPLGIVEAALMIEAGYHARMDRLMVCWCRPEQQLERLLARGLSAAEAQARIAAQLPIEEKLRLATDTMDCSGTLEATRAATAQLVQAFNAIAASKRPE
jgi:dephospho-CoA kinase